MWGAPIPFAYALQGALTIAVRLWRSAASPALKSAALCLAAILATPYSLDYDMMVLAPAIAFLATDGLRRGFGPWEKTGLAALWLVPLVTRNVAQASLIPLGVPAMLAVFMLLVRRAELDPRAQKCLKNRGFRAALNALCSRLLYSQQAYASMSEWSPHALFIRMFPRSKLLMTKRRHPVSYKFP